MNIIGHSRGFTCEYNRALTFEDLAQCISANKLLGLFGQDFPIPQTGHAFHESAWNLKDTVTIIISHSGGTFGSLAVSNLLQAYTERIFVIASESDTQVGKQLRQIHKYNV